MIEDFPISHFACTTYLRKYARICKNWHEAVIGLVGDCFASLFSLGINEDDIAAQVTF